VRWMSILRNSYVKQLLATLMLVVWAAAYHHEEWTELADVAHSHSHSHHHGDATHGEHDEAPLSGEDSPIPLPDTHSTAVALSSTKTLSDYLSSENGGFLISSQLFVLADEWSRASRASTDSPHFLQAVPHDPAVPRLLILASSIRANAPPALS
jgi:hypothetical protein